MTVPETGAGIGQRGLPGVNHGVYVTAAVI
jgi:hypothetical protein